MNAIPFFYYDIVARIFPGGITLAVFALARPEILGLASGTEGWKTVVVPITLAAAAYMAGVLFEAITPDGRVWRWISDKTFESAAEEYSWKGQKPDLQKLEDSRKFREEAWFDLILAGERDEAQAFAHALRMWAEAKMCLHSFLPVFVASIVFALEREWFWAASAGVVAVWLLYGVYSRDKRRWIQILNSKDRMNG